MLSSVILLLFRFCQRLFLPTEGGWRRTKTPWGSAGQVRSTFDALAAKVSSPPAPRNAQSCRSRPFCVGTSAFTKGFTIMKIKKKPNEAIVRLFLLFKTF
ncbi:hypothetical protein B1B05_05345 [Domibacillus enclensis]|uniref:Secreted protein n=1 Tax=Domibacillus enclensis TaxID=1017273 RepID=A0ABX4EB14_9BACI|nr:hypothetical protein B1B05_05345 [Domibacillus enclensis]